MVYKPEDQHLNVHHHENLKFPEYKVTHCLVILDEKLGNSQTHIYLKQPACLCLKPIAIQRAPERLDSVVSLFIIKCFMVGNSRPVPL